MESDKSAKNPMEEWADFEELQEFTVSLVSDHLSLAMDLLSESHKYARASWHWMQSHRQAMSSIMHSFFALESAINVVGHRLFFDPTSPDYIPPEKWDIPLRLMIDRWWTGLSWHTKFKYILSINSCSLDSTFEQELLECARMRNLIAHGNPYKQTILFEIDFLGPTVADREVHFDFKQFSHTKMKSPAFVDHEDAYTVNKIILEALKILATQTGKRFVVNTMNKNQFLALIGDDFDVNGFLKTFTK
jgi:hypothetical protein